MRKRSQYLANPSFRQIRRQFPPGTPLNRDLLSGSSSCNIIPQLCHTQNTWWVHCCERKCPVSMNMRFDTGYLPLILFGATSFCNTNGSSLLNLLRSISNSLDIIKKFNTYQPWRSSPNSVQKSEINSTSLTSPYLSISKTSFSVGGIVSRSSPE